MHCASPYRLKPTGAYERGGAPKHAPRCHRHRPGGAEKAAPPPIWLKNVPTPLKTDHRSRGQWLRRPRRPPRNALMYGGSAYSNLRSQRVEGFEAVVLDAE